MKKLFLIIFLIPLICFSLSAKENPSVVSEKQKIKEFSKCWKEKYNNADLQTKINLNADRYWQRSEGKTKRNFITCEWEPHAPFYKPKRIGCANPLKPTSKLKEQILNQWLIERTLKSNGVDVGQNTCEQNYTLYFR